MELVNIMVLILAYLVLHSLLTRPRRPRRTVVMIEPEEEYSGCGIQSLLALALGVFLIFILFT